MTDDLEYADLLRRALIPVEQNGTGNCVFRALSPHGDKFYFVTYPGWYGWMLSEFDEAGLLMNPAMAQPVSDTESDLARIRVTVTLYRKWTMDSANQLADVIRGWFEETGSKGIFGEGPASSVSSQLHFRGKTAAFEIDGSSSGQETLNTLALAILNWGMLRRQPLRSIDVADTEAEKVFQSGSLVRLR